MRLRVRLYAIARQLAGMDAIELDLPEDATVGRLRAALAQQVPALAPIAGSCLFAVDAEYRPDDAPLSPGVEIACLPPVSGG